MTSLATTNPPESQVKMSKFWKSDLVKLKGTFNKSLGDLFFLNLVQEWEIPTVEMKSCLKFQIFGEFDQATTLH